MSRSADRIIEALVKSGRLHDGEDRDGDAIKAAMYQLLDDMVDGELPMIRNEGEPHETIEEAVDAVFNAFADKVLGRLN